MEAAKVWPEKEVNFISQIYFGYFWKMLLKGWKNTLTIKDLWSVHKCEEASFVHKTLAKNYQEMKLKYPTSKRGLTFTRAMFKTHWKLIVISFFLICLGDLLAFLVVLNVKWMIELASDPIEPRWHGGAYVFLLFVVQLIMGICFIQNDHLVAKVGVRLQAATAAMVFQKALRLSPTARRRYNAGEITNLASVDAGQFLEHAKFIHYLWSAPILICLGCYLLHSVVGHAFWIGMLPLIISTIINGLCGIYYEKFYASQMSYKDERVRLLAEILRIISVAKLFAWEPAFQRFVDKIRTKEIHMTKKLNVISGVGDLTWFSTTLMSCALVFTTYCLAMGKPLTPVMAFTVVAVFAAYLRQLVLLPQCIFGATAISASFKRLDEFMAAEELDFYVDKTGVTEGITVLLEAANLGWDQAKEASLRNIALKFHRDELAAVVGPVGSGKSSLLSAVAGEMYLLSGKIKTGGIIAYVPQQSWILNDSVRGNILFNKPYDEEWYQKVIKACALEADFECLPAADLTEIGERGVNLSGGQKQRVSLARAVYQNCDIFLLDDPLSAVDVHVQAHLFKEVIGPTGLLAEKTRILVTNALPVLPQCDRVIVMKHGEIAACGTFDEISKSHPMYLVRDKKDRKKSIGKAIDQESRMQVQKTKEQAIDGKLMNEETMATGKVTWGTYWLYCKAGGWAFLIAAIGTTLALICNTVAFIWLQKWIDSFAVQQKQDHDVTVDQKETSSFPILLGVQIILGIVFIFGFVRYATQASKLLHSQLLKRILRCPISFFTTTPMGRILNRFGQDINNIDIIIPMAIMRTIGFSVSMILAVVPSIYATPILTVFLIPAIVVVVIFQKLYITSSRQFQRLESLSRSPVYSRLHDVLQGPENVRIFSQECIFIQSFHGMINMNSGATMCNSTAGRWLVIHLNVIANTVATCATLLVLLSPNSSPGLVGLSVSAVITVIDFLIITVCQTCDTETAMVSVERVEEYLQLSSEAAWTSSKLGDNDNSDKGAKNWQGWWHTENPAKASRTKALMRRIFCRDQTVEYTPLRSLTKDRYSFHYGSISSSGRPEVENSGYNMDFWPNAGVIEFINYSLKYRSDLPLALKNISLRIGAGEKVGIVGRTGAGKTSLVAGLFRLVEPSNGKIVIDNIDISTLGLHDLRRKLTIIPQDPALFSGTIRQNLDPFGEYSDDEIWNVLQLSHLKKFAVAQMNGLEFHVDDGGSNLSVGQRQLLCLARALLKKSKILVLDEATAFVDLETDKLIQNAICTQFADCTVVTIAHRLQTIIDYDSVAILSEGQIIEHGRIKQLLKVELSEFRQMVMKANVAKVLSDQE